ncbi:hypothetical protein HRbin09_00532 [bacterium HR09]|nr:hypothetical protein HRbin09_00532 [bacterium HR09]
MDSRNSLGVVGCGIQVKDVANQHVVVLADTRGRPVPCVAREHEAARPNGVHHHVEEHRVVGEASPVGAVGGVRQGRLANIILRQADDRGLQVRHDRGTQGREVTVRERAPGPGNRVSILRLEPRRRQAVRFRTPSGGSGTDRPSEKARGPRPGIEVIKPTVEEIAEVDGPNVITGQHLVEVHNGRGPDIIDGHVDQLRRPRNVGHRKDRGVPVGVGCPSGGIQIYHGIRHQKSGRRDVVTRTEIGVGNAAGQGQHKSNSKYLFHSLSSFRLVQTTEEEHVTNRPLFPFLTPSPPLPSLRAPSAPLCFTVIKLDPRKRLVKPPASPAQAGTPRAHPHLAKDRPLPKDRRVEVKIGCRSKASASPPSFQETH